MQFSSDPRYVLIVERSAIAPSVPISINLCSEFPYAPDYARSKLSDLLPTNLASPIVTTDSKDSNDLLQELCRARIAAILIEKEALDRYGGAKLLAENSVLCMILPLSVFPSLPEIAADEQSKPQPAAAYRVSLAADARLEEARRIECARYAAGVCRGVSALAREYGVVVFASTEESGDVSVTLCAADRNHPRVPADQLWPATLADQAVIERHDLAVSPPRDFNACAVYISRADALPADWDLTPGQLVWCAGTKTWRALAKRGIWVWGTSDSLGEDEPTGIDDWFSSEICWVKLSHRGGALRSDRQLIATYEITDIEILPEIGGKTHIYWRSGSTFAAALSRFPAIADAWHGCGPGHTYRTIRECLPQSDRLGVYLSHEEWLSSVLENQP